MNCIRLNTLAAALLLVCAGTVSAQQSSVQHNRSAAPNGIPAGGPYVPAGNLYDNEQSNGLTSLASQNSSGTLTARSADDFILTGTCASGLFDITSIRTHMVQADAAAQAFGVEVFADNGLNTAPAPGMTPIQSATRISQVNFGAFGAGTSIFEASFATTGMQLAANTRYWISGFGTDPALNPASFNNFFASSAGATGTTANGVVIAPGSGVADWTPAHLVIGGDPLAFSFAIDGVCVVEAAGPATPVPATTNPALILGGLMLGLLGVVAVRRSLA